MKKLRMLALLLTIAMLLPLTARAGRQWVRGGRYATGVFPDEEGCPIVAEQVNLTFDTLRRDEETENTQGFITAEYTLRNPTEDTVRVRMFYPFGSIPSDIQVDGEPLAPTLRHSYLDYSEAFSIEQRRLWIIDGWAEDSFYDPEMTVTRYTYHIQPGDSMEGEFALVADDKVQVTCSVDPENTRVHLDPVLRAESTDGTLVLTTDFRHGTHVGEGRNFCLYVIGAPLKTDPVWSAYDSGGSEHEALDVSTELVSTEQIPLKELFCMHKGTMGRVSQTDWYNAVLHKVRENDSGEGYLGWYDVLDVSEDLMRWYEYELTFQPGQSLVNTVTVPLHPSVDEKTEPYKYGYTYQFSAEQRWAFCGPVNVTVNTPFYMLDTNQEGFEKTETGYRLTLERLPEGELTFRLCESEHPEFVAPTTEDYYSRMVGPAWSFLLKAVAVVSVLAYLRHLLRKKKSN